MSGLRWQERRAKERTVGGSCNTIHRKKELDFFKRKVVACVRIPFLRFLKINLASGAKCEEKNEKKEKIQKMKYSQP